MNNIKPYNEYKINEADSSEDLLGVVAHLKIYGGDQFYYTYYMCVAPTFWDVAEGIIREDFDDEVEPENVSGLLDIHGLTDMLWDNYLSDGMVEDIELTVWSGLTPRTKTPAFESLYSMNPYDIVGAIDSMFTNGKEVMLKNHGGDRDSMDLIVSSVKNDMSKISVYAEKDIEMARKIANKAGIPDDKFNSIIKYSNIKKQI